MLDIRQDNPEDEARRTAALLDAVATEAERLGHTQNDPAMRQRLLGQVARSRADANHIRSLIDSR